MMGPGRPADIQPRAGPSQPTAGPSLPPHLRQAAAELSDDEDDDDYTPALPPGMPARNAQGPSLPSHLANRRRSPSPVSGDDSDDSDVGPLPAPSAGPAPVLSAAEEFRLREQRKQEEEEEERRITGQKPKREAWMTVPPSALDSLAHQDPTKITKRGFNQSSRQGAAGKPADGAASLWTETPEERAKRIEDEVMGKRKRIENATKEETESQRIERKKREARDAHMRSQTDAYNVSSANPVARAELSETESLTWFFCTNRLPHHGPAR